MQSAFWIEISGFQGIFKELSRSTTGCPKTMYPTLTFYFEAVTTIMPGTLGFPVSPDLYNSFETLLICFHDLINECNKLFSKLDFAENWNSVEFL